MHCDQCEMLSINGVACHELGCPNMHARWSEECYCWIKQRECFDCGCMVDADDPCCSAQSEDDRDQGYYDDGDGELDEDEDDHEWW
jgi:hypothetical protein